MSQPGTPPENALPPVLKSAPLRTTRGGSSVDFCCCNGTQGEKMVPTRGRSHAIYCFIDDPFRESKSATALCIAVTSKLSLGLSPVEFSATVQPGDAKVSISVVRPALSREGCKPSAMQKSKKAI